MRTLLLNVKIGHLHNNNLLVADIIVYHIAKYFFEEFIHNFDVFVVFFVSWQRLPHEDGFAILNEKFLDDDLLETATWAVVDQVFALLGQLFGGVELYVWGKVVDHVKLLRVVNFQWIGDVCIWSNGLDELGDFFKFLHFLRRLIALTSKLLSLLTTNVHVAESADIVDLLFFLLQVIQFLLKQTFIDHRCEGIGTWFLSLTLFVKGLLNFWKHLFSLWG